MKILWCTWKDIQHPYMGGAEVVNHELAKRLVKDGHEVIFLVGGFEGAQQEQMIDGYKVIRVGSRWSVYWKAYQYYKLNLKGWADVVIDEINTIPFFSRFYAKHGEKNVLFIHQLAREIWFYEMFFPLSLLGYLLEPLYLYLLGDTPVITVSESSKKDIARFGFREENIHIISEGIELTPLQSLPSGRKYEYPTILSVGTLRSMKRTKHIIKAFELAKEKLPVLELILAGKADNSYGKRILKYISHSPFKASITYLGKVNEEKKAEIMRKSHLLAVTSVKEGWGLIVTEANSQGTPAIVYDVDGLRDSVKNMETGIVCKSTPQDMADQIVITLREPERYEVMSQKALEWSKTITFEKSYQDFINILTKLK